MYRRIPIPIRITLSILHKQDTTTSITAEAPITTEAPSQPEIIAKWTESIQQEGKRNA